MGVVLPWLNKVKVGALTLRESVVTVELKLGGDYRVLAPAVHVERGLGENERTSIRYGGSLVGTSNLGISEVSGGSGLTARKVGKTVFASGVNTGDITPLCANLITYISGTSIVEHARSINERGGGRS